METPNSPIPITEGEFTRCELYHNVAPPLATGNILCPFGRDGIREAELLISVCDECYEALQGDEWILHYCFVCDSSRWSSRKHSRLKYPEGKSILWYRGCHGCSGFNGLYFQELEP